MALVGANGSVDWSCFPRVDSPSVFSAILDDKKGGYFRISSQTDNITYKQLYWPELRTGCPSDANSPRRSGVRWTGPQPGVGIARSRNAGSQWHRRRAGPARGPESRLGAAADSTRLQLRSGQVGAGGGGRFRTDDQLLARLDLKMLVHGTLAGSGASCRAGSQIAHAATCSLPEAVGGSRNWDYRYSWIRDAAFTLYGLLRIGLTEEAARFMDWVEARCHELDPDGQLQIMYVIDERHALTEEMLDHLDGYKGSRPVRIGNAAYQQLPLDTCGELMDSVYLYNKYGNPISYEFWSDLRRLINWTSDNWARADEGIWEARAGKRHFVYSKLMCWVALDRALRLADKRSFPADRERWLTVRDQIYEDVIANGWSNTRQSFVQYYGGDSLDASNLIMPLVFFIQTPRC